MKVFLFPLITVVTFFLNGPISLWNQKTPSTKIDGVLEMAQTNSVVDQDQDQEDPSTSKNTSSEQSSTSPKIFHSLYQTAILSSSAGSASTNHRFSESLTQKTLPPTKHPIEREAAKGISTYVGILVGVAAASYVGSLFLANGLSSPLMEAVMIFGTGIIVAVAFTYCAWKFWDYVYES